MLALFQIIILIFSAVIHEVSHGLMAQKLGDNTAKLLGRLTLNPFKHLDFFGSFIFPFSLYILSGGNFVFGWAKPVPYNPLNLKNPIRDSGLIALAGPLSNFIIALFFGLILRFGGIEFLNSNLGYLFIIIVLINILLGVFNLIPIPPLDGSKVLIGFLPFNLKVKDSILVFFERYGLILILFFIFFGFRIVWLLVNIIFRFIVGINIDL